MLATLFFLLLSAAVGVVDSTVTALADECIHPAYTFCSWTAKLEKKYTFEAIKATGMKVEAAALDASQNAKVQKKLFTVCMSACCDLKEDATGISLFLSEKACKSRHCLSVSMCDMMPTELLAQVEGLKDKKEPKNTPCADAIIKAFSPETGCPDATRYGLGMGDSFRMSPVLVQKIKTDWAQEFGKHGYALKGFLGEGMMGAVFQVEKDKKVFAMKVAFCNKLNSEIDMLKALQGKTGVVKFHTNGVSLVAPDKWQFYIMDKTGPSMLKLMEHNLVSPAGFRRAMWLTLKILEGLHNKNKCFSHADVGTRNIVIDLNDKDHKTIMLIDYGLTKTCSESDSNDIIKDYGTLYDTIAKCGAGGEPVHDMLLQKTICSPNLPAYEVRGVNELADVVLAHTDKVKKGLPLANVAALHTAFEDKLKAISGIDPSAKGTAILTGDIPSKLLEPEPL